jgi:hypothetical protein
MKLLGQLEERANEPVRLKREFEGLCEVEEGRYVYDCRRDVMVDDGDRTVGVWMRHVNDRGVYCAPNRDAGPVVVANLFAGATTLGLLDVVRLKDGGRLMVSVRGLEVGSGEEVMEKTVPREVGGEGIDLSGLVRRVQGTRVPVEVRVLYAHVPEEGARRHGRIVFYIACARSYVL